MNLFERFRAFWKPRPPDDHPLTQQERDEDHPESTYDELARNTERFVGDDFDPDEPRSG